MVSSPVMDLTLVERFRTLFTGYSQAHGRYDVPAAKVVASGDKVQGRPWTVRGAPSLDVYLEHLSGTGPGLGVIMLRDDDTVVFGAVDYDVRTMNHAKACEAIDRLNLPLVLCRSKSGGGHFYCFTTEPVPASLMRERLDEWKALLGMASKTETFPKQSSRVDESDIGSWINLPYYRYTDTVRYAFRGGVQLALEEFLNYAEARRVSMEQLGVSKIKEQNDEKALFHEGPPCLQVLASRGGFGEGERNLGMAAVIVYLRKRFPDDWQQRVDEYNAKMAGLPSAEIQHIIKTHSKKAYSYQCKQPPINAVCQRGVCRGRLFGIGQSPDDAQSGAEITSITRYDPSHGDEPVWGMEINGKRLMVSNADFYSRDAFNRACMAQANVVPIHMPPARWLKFLGTLLPQATIVPLPSDASPTGQLWESIEGFCAQRNKASAREEMLLGGKTYLEKGRIYFRSADLFAYLDQRRIQYKSPQWVWKVLKDHEATQDFWHLKGKKGINVWSVPAPEDTGELTEALSTTQTEQF